jgi:hypothetical protein
MDPIWLDEAVVVLDRRINVSQSHFVARDVVRHVSVLRVPDQRIQHIRLCRVGGAVPRK